MNYYNFPKKIYIKKDHTFCIEIYLKKDIFNDFNYKIAGSLGYYEYGNYSSYKNNNNNNIIIFTIDIIQTLFISIKQNNLEYFSFINENCFTESITKNININIKKINKYTDNLYNDMNDHLYDSDSSTTSTTSIISTTSTTSKTSTDLSDNNIKINYNTLNKTINNTSNNINLSNEIMIDNIDNI